MAILIASTRLDAPTYQPVVDGLTRYGNDVVVYNTDDVVTGRVPLSIATTEGFSYGSRDIGFSDIAASWYRHPTFIGLSIDDKAKLMMLEQEVQSLQDYIWESVPDDRWLNAPGKMQKARNKLGQLALAKGVGFTVPDTLVTNRWGVVEEKYGEDDIVIKMSKGFLYENNRAMTLYSTRVPHALRYELQANSPFPSIIQNYIPKSREWRITAVGDELFGAVIYAGQDAQDDWRKYMFTGQVRFSTAEVPDDVAAKCFAYLGALSLQYGAFDIIEEPTGEMIFLECNPNGQYMWLEEDLGLPISGAIVDRLAKIAHDNSR